MKAKEHVQEVGLRALQHVKRYFPKVTKVSDADKPLDLIVTQNDDKVGRKKDHAECAMAVAAKRQLKVDGAIISRRIVYLVRGTEATRYTTSSATLKEIIAFDRGGYFAPGTYTLYNPPERERLGLYKQSGDDESGRDRHTKNKLVRHVFTKGVRGNLNSFDDEAA